MGASAATPCRRKRSWQNACRAGRVIRPKAKGSRARALPGFVPRIKAARKRLRRDWARLPTPCLSLLQARRAAVRSSPRVRPCRTKASPAAMVRGPSWVRPLSRPRCRRRRVGRGLSRTPFGFRRPSRDCVGRFALPRADGARRARDNVAAREALAIRQRRTLRPTLAQPAMPASRRARRGTASFSRPGAPCPWAPARFRPCRPTRCKPAAPRAGRAVHRQRSRKHLALRRGRGATTIASRAARFRAQTAAFAGARGAWPSSDGRNGAAATLPSSPRHLSGRRQPSSQTGRHDLFLPPVRSTDRKRDARPNLPIGVVLRPASKKPLRQTDHPATQLMGENGRMIRIPLAVDDSKTVAERKGVQPVRESSVGIWPQDRDRLLPISIRGAQRDVIDRQRAAILA